jgi:hypothetical protein
MMLIGLIWAALAPLLLLLVAVGVAWWLRRANIRRAWPLALVAVATPVGSVWLWERAEFVSVCEGEGKPAIYRRAVADGVFLNSGTANSFGTRYLYDEGFAWIEAPSIYKRGEWVRYELGGGKGSERLVTSTEIPAITARYEVREDFSQSFGHTGLSQTKVIDRTTNEVMAKAGSATFSGGKMKWALGAWGSLSCPSAFSAPEDFNAYYRLAKKTLRP